MAEPTSQHNKYMPGYKIVPHHEWRNVENSAAYLLPTLRSKLASNPQLRILDVGCGSGTITASLAQHAPQATIIGIDLADEILDKARSFSSRAGVSNTSFQKGSVYDLPFADESFDIVHASMVLVHLDSPVQAFREMLRVTKPGGVVADREADLRAVVFHPESKGLRRAQELILKTHAAAGGAVDAGVRLTGWAMQAGVDRGRIQAGMSTWFYGSREEREMWGGMWAGRLRDSGGMHQKAFDVGFVQKEEEIEDMARAWEEWIEVEGACFASMHGEVILFK